MTVLERVQKLCKQHGIGIAKMERDIDLSKGASYKWKTSDPSMDTLKRLAEYFNVPVDVFTDGGNTPSSDNSVRIKVLGSVPAGIPLDAIEDVVGWEDIPKNWTNGGKEYFALKVKGNSMSPEYLDGDVIILRKQDDCESGDDCVVYVGDYEATFKHVIKKANHVILQPVNSTYEPIMCEYDKSIKIAGVVVEMRRKKGNR